MSSELRTGPIVAASIGVVATGFLAYALYFDHRRRTDADFRKALKRESRRQDKIAKAESAAEVANQRKQIRELLEEANKEGFPTDPERVEEYFLAEVAAGEEKCTDGSDPIEAALCFYKALKVYPSPRELIQIFDKTVAKPVLDVLAEMIATDTSIRTGTPPGSDRGVDD